MNRRGNATLSTVNITTVSGRTSFLFRVGMLETRDTTTSVANVFLEERSSVISILAMSVDMDNTYAVHYMAVAG